MKHKITTGIAFLGLSLVLLSFVFKYLYPISFNIRTAMLVVGFALMLLGTLWKVVIDMNDDKSAD